MRLDQLLRYISSLLHLLESILGLIKPHPSAVYCVLISPHAALEALSRGKRTANTPSNFKRTIPIRGVNEVKVEDPTSQLADWKEGALL